MSSHKYDKNNIFFKILNNQVPQVCIGFFWGVPYIYIYVYTRVFEAKQKQTTHAYLFAIRETTVYHGEAV